MDQKVNSHSNVASEKAPVKGVFTEFKGERFYKISNVDQMPAFFMSVVSDNDHWLFISSNSGCTAGRVSADYALFPYQAVDKVQDSVEHTGTKTIIRVMHNQQPYIWEPFEQISSHPQDIERHLYKNTLGNRLCFEEVNHALGLSFRFMWQVSDAYGFVIENELVNDRSEAIDIEMIDGLLNILPAGAPREVQTNASNLVDAYRLAEVDTDTGLAIYSLYSGITDKPQPVEVLRANTVFCHGLEVEQHLLSAQPLTDFRRGNTVYAQNQLKGLRNAYLVSSNFTLHADQAKYWHFVANVNQTQNQIEILMDELSQEEDQIAQALVTSVRRGSEQLLKLMAQADACQQTQLESDQVHHYSNVLFNTMRGGIFDDQYTIESADFVADVRHFNRKVFQAHEVFLNGLPTHIQRDELHRLVLAQADSQLLRLFSEYLPITFGRRHGDPSRPWNQFAIKIKDDHGHRLLSYQGNWRDIFQNWEALLMSYPEFTESVVAKFVNASTIDGFNPYRITKQGIDWEIEDPKDPWSYIGYWGDHQIIYLLKLLELSSKYHPETLQTLLHQKNFCYANVPYRIHRFEQILRDSKNTVHYDEQVETLIAERVAMLGADGKMVLDQNDSVYQVNLFEKLLVPLLSKLSNFVLRGGIWLNTQRPEWNDANNALVGQGLSMVTLYYMRRYVAFMMALLQQDDKGFECSHAVVSWYHQVHQALASASGKLASTKTITPEDALYFLTEVGQAASDYRQKVYQQGFDGELAVLQPYDIVEMLKVSLDLIDDSIRFNQRLDGLFHAYNVLRIDASGAHVDYLYEMLEGQVSALSSGVLSSEEVINVMQGLFASDMYREDQKTFMLYPDEPVQSFLNKNVISDEFVSTNLYALMACPSQRILQPRFNGNGYRFQADLASLDEVSASLVELEEALGDAYSSVCDAVMSEYKRVFNHKEFTGRSHGMFGFEGLGCIYWHMVSKLLLACQESFMKAVRHKEPRQTIQALGDYYYRVREGIGFNKNPEEYGAFPYDPYSHTPKHSGAQQPGMTGQVKEEVITRFGELGVEVSEGCITFNPVLLRSIEFITEESHFNYVDMNGHKRLLELPAQSLAFTLCQTPVVYHLTESDVHIELYTSDGIEMCLSQTLSLKHSASIFKREQKIEKIVVLLNKHHCFN